MIVVALFEGRGPRQQHMRKRGGFRIKDVHRHNQFQGSKRLSQPLAVRVRQQRVTGKTNQCTNLSRPFGFYFFGKADNRQLSSYLRSTRYTTEPASILDPRLDGARGARHDLLTKQRTTLHIKAAEQEIQRLNQEARERTKGLQRRADAAIHHR